MMITLQKLIKNTLSYKINEKKRAKIMICIDFFINHLLDEKLIIYIVLYINYSLI